MAEGFVSILYSDKQLNYAVDDIFISYVGNKDSVFAISDCNEEVTCTRVINSLAKIGADVYTSDAASTAEAAVALCG